MEVWDKGGDLCNIPSSPELRFTGDKPFKVSEFEDYSFHGQTISQDLSVDSFVTTLSRLNSLKVVSLVSLDIWGPLPHNIHRLYSVKVLNLSFHFLYGSIPPPPPPPTAILRAWNNFLIPSFGCIRPTVTNAYDLHRIVPNKKYLVLEDSEWFDKHINKSNIDRKRIRKMVSALQVMFDNQHFQLLHFNKILEHTIGFFIFFHWWCIWFKMNNTF